jgi:hypothetical protein
MYDYGGNCKSIQKGDFRASLAMTTGVFAVIASICPRRCASGLFMNKLVSGDPSYIPPCNYKGGNKAVSLHA